MNIDTVNPIPQTTQTLAKAFHVAPEGSDTTPRRIAIHEKENTPANLPTTRPNMAARLTPEKSVPTVMPERTMPALAKAKRGMTT